MKKIILTTTFALLLTTTLAGCKGNQETHITEKLTLVSYTEMEDYDSFLDLKFITEEGEEIHYSAHDAYLRFLKEGKTYQFKYRESAWNRPDNEMVEIEPSERRE